MRDSITTISLRNAALIAGVSILVMVIAAPFAELYMYPKLVISGDASQTTKNILANMGLFRAGILCYVITFICDILAAWALYILLKPVNDNISQLTALFRLVYTIIALVALVNLVIVLQLLNTNTTLSIFKQDQLYNQVMLSLISYSNAFHFGILFFGIHLGLLGYLVYKSSYIPKILGLLLVIAGLGYLANGLKPFLFPAINIDFAVYTFYGELFFMFWLLIKGSKIKEQI